MNKLYYYFILFCSLLSVSCRQAAVKDGIFCNSHCIVETVEGKDTIAGKVIIPHDTTAYVSYVNVADNYIILRTDKPNSIISVYDLTGRFIGSFGDFGNARNEFSEGYAMNLQCINGDVWGRDANFLNLWSFDVNASLKAKKPIVKKMFAIEHGAKNAFYINDTTIVYDKVTVDNIQLKTVNPTSKATVNSYDLYTPNNNANNLYISHTAINTEQEKLVMGMLFVNQVNFMSLKDGSRSSISLYKDAVVSNDLSKRILYYRCVAPTKRRVCLLYTNLALTDLTKLPSTTEIHVFDWDGKFHKKIIANDALTIITFDKDNNMYGLDKNGNVLKYENVDLN